MRKKLISPSLDLRSEPPNSKAVVLNADADTRRALVRFRGKEYQAQMIDTDIVQGDSVAFIEHPRNSYWIRRNGPSWYANPLSNWLKRGKKGHVAMEYFLRKNPKYCPFQIREGSDGFPELLEIPGKNIANPLGEFSDLDKDGDGKISPAEFPGDTDTFNQLDKDGDGFISEEEWNDRSHKNMGGNKIRLYQYVPGGGAVPPVDDGWEDFTDPITMPGGFPAADENSWWGFIQFPKTSPYSMSPSYVSQRYSGIVGSNIATDTPITGFTLDSEQYFYGKPNVSFAQSSQVVQGDYLRVFIRGAAGTSGSKKTFDRMLCNLSSSTASVSTSATTEQYQDYLRSVAELDAYQESVANDFRAIGPTLVIVQNGGTPRQKSFTFFVEFNEFTSDGQEKHVVGSLGEVEA